MIILVFLYGLLFGSFYNVCIYRLPVSKSVITPRSSCGSCGHTLSGFDLIPVLSYAYSGGKCRHCGAKYSMRYALVELLTGFLFALCYLVYGMSFEFLVGIVLSSIVIIVTFIDIDHHIILDRFSIITISLAVIYHAYMQDQSMISIILGFIIGGGFLFIVALIGTMGGGDIKIMASFGLLLGFKNIIIAFYLAFVVGSIIMLPLALYKKKKNGVFESKVPFGPFLSFAALVTYLFSDSITNMYMNMFF